MKIYYYTCAKLYSRGIVVVAAANERQALDLIKEKNAHECEPFLDDLCGDDMDEEDAVFLIQEMQDVVPTASEPKIILWKG